MASEEFIKKSDLIMVLEQLYAKFGERKYIRTKTMIEAIKKMPAYTAESFRPIVKHESEDHHGM